MMILDFNEKFDKSTCVALGYFDSVHNGHASLIEACRNSGFTPAVFTFSNSPYSLLGGIDENVFTYKERTERLELLGVQLCINATFNQAFMDISAKDFLNELVNNFCVKKVVVGSDYSCGKGAEFKAEDVKKYLISIGVDCVIMPLINMGYSKIASSLIKEYIKLGDIESINKLLPFNYSISGKVEHGRKEGSKILGFPTANVSFHKGKMLLKEGVYYTKIAINGKLYNAITNVGNHPTFDDYNFNIESFILGFNGSIYDENIKVEFIARLRDTMKFSSIDALIEQIQKDVRRVEQWQ